MSQAYRKQSASLSRNPAEVHLHRPRLLPRENRSPRADSHETARSSGRETSARVTRSRVAGQETATRMSSMKDNIARGEESGVPADQNRRRDRRTRRRKVLHVCRDEKCQVHAASHATNRAPQERAARAKELLAERIEKQTRVRILNAIRKKLPCDAVASRPRNGRARLLRAARP